MFNREQFSREHFTARKACIFAFSQVLDPNQSIQWQNSTLWLISDALYEARFILGLNISAFPQLPRFFFFKLDAFYNCPRSAGTLLLFRMGRAWYGTKWKWRTFWCVDFHGKGGGGGGGDIPTLHNWIVHHSSQWLGLSEGSHLVSCLWFSNASLQTFAKRKVGEITYLPPLLPSVKSNIASWQMEMGFHWRKFAKRKQISSLQQVFFKKANNEAL